MGYTMDTLESLVLSAAKKSAVTTEEITDEVEVIEGAPAAPATPPLKSDTYFPINLQIGNQAATQPTTTAVMTEEQKRKRMIVIMGAVLAAVMILVMVLAFTGKKQ